VEIIDTFANASGDSEGEEDLMEEEEHGVYNTIASTQFDSEDLSDDEFKETEEYESEDVDEDESDKEKPVTKKTEQRRTRKLLLATLMKARIEADAKKK
jgi:hypothetical protein